MSEEDTLAVKGDSEEAQEEEEQELVDPLDSLKEYCSKTTKCSQLLEKLNTCNDRVNSRTKTLETCVEELFDYVHCVDHCVAPKLFSKLK